MQNEYPETAGINKLLVVRIVNRAPILGEGLLYFALMLCRIVVLHFGWSGLLPTAVVEA